MLSFLLSWSPVLLLMFLAIIFRRPAFDLSIAGLVYTAFLVVFFYNTPWMVVFRAGLDGVLTTLPLLLVVFCGVFLSITLMETGALKRISEWLLLGVKSVYQRELLISIGVGNFMEGSSVIAEPVVAPMLRAAGVSPTGSAVLAIAGYAGLMTLEMAGIIITVLSLITNIPINELAMAAAWLSIPSTMLTVMCVPFYLDGDVKRWQRFILPVALGFLASAVALLTVWLIGVTVSGMLGGLAVVLTMILFGTRRLPWNRSIARDLTPFAFVLFSLLLVNTVPALRVWTFQKLTCTVQLIQVHPITFRPFFSAYLYVLIAGILSVVLFKISKPRLIVLIKKTTLVGTRVTVTMMLFSAMGQIIAFSGYSTGFEMDAAHNIPQLLASGLIALTGDYFPIAVPFLGWVGTFLTGYGVASLMLFGQIQVETAGLLGVSATWLAAGLAVGASIGSISSPFKIALATPMCEALGKEGDILRVTIPLGIFISFLTGFILWLVL